MVWIILQIIKEQRPQYMSPVIHRSNLYHDAPLICYAYNHPFFTNVLYEFHTPLNAQSVDEAVSFCSYETQVSSPFFQGPSTPLSHSIEKRLSQSWDLSSWCLDWSYMQSTSLDERPNIRAGLVSNLSMPCAITGAAKLLFVSNDPERKAHGFTRALTSGPNCE